MVALEVGRSLRDSPPELFPGDDAVVVGERLLHDAALNIGQQTTDAAGRWARFGCRTVVVLETAPVSGVHPRTVVDHGVGDNIK